MRWRTVGLQLPHFVRSVLREPEFAAMSVPEPTEIETFTPHPDKAQDEEAVEETTSMELAVSIAVEAKGLETSTGDLPGPVTALENGAAYLEDTNELAEKDEKIEVGLRTRVALFRFLALNTF